MISKILRTIIALPFLVACDPAKPTTARCEGIVNQNLRADLFDKCLMRAAEARKGTSYSTHDDEDYDEVISECNSVAYSMAISREHCGSKP